MTPSTVPSVYPIFVPTATSAPSPQPSVAPTLSPAVPTLSPALTTTTTISLTMTQVLMNVSALVINSDDFKIPFKETVSYVLVNNKIYTNDVTVSSLKRRRLTSIVNTTVTYTIAMILERSPDYETSSDLQNSVVNSIILSTTASTSDNFATILKRYGTDVKGLQSLSSVSVPQLISSKESTSSTGSSASSSSKKTDSTGSIIGGCIGALAGIALLFLVWRKYMMKKTIARWNKNDFGDDFDLYSTLGTMSRRETFGSGKQGSNSLGGEDDFVSMSPSANPRSTHNNATTSLRGDNNIVYTVNPLSQLKQDQHVEMKVTQRSMSAEEPMAHATMRPLAASNLYDSVGEAGEPQQQTEQGLHTLLPETPTRRSSKIPVLKERLQSFNLHAETASPVEGENPVLHRLSSSRKLLSSPVTSDDPVRRVSIEPITGMKRGSVQTLAMSFNHQKKNSL